MTQIPPETLAIGMALTSLSFVLGILFQSLPIPKKDIKMWGNTLVWDSLIALFALSTVTFVQSLVQWSSNLIVSTIGAQIGSQHVSTGLIVSQLVSLDSAIILLVGVVSSTVILQPVGTILAHMLGQLASWITAALVMWLIVEAINSILPNIWLAFYTLGTALLAVPFRLGRGIGGALMATSVVLVLMLPLLPVFAIWFEGMFGYQSAIQPLNDLIAQIQRNPLKAIFLIPQLPATLGALLVSVVVGLVIFPIVYFVMMSLVARAIGRLIGASSLSLSNVGLPYGV